MATMLAPEAENGNCLELPTPWSVLKPEWDEIDPKWDEMAI